MFNNPDYLINSTLKVFNRVYKKIAKANCLLQNNIEKHLEDIETMKQKQDELNSNITILDFKIEHNKKILEKLRDLL